MIRRKIFTILTAVFMVLAFSAMSFAANQVNLKTTVPNIPKSYCWQAGTDTMEFDDGSKMAEGDVITVTLNNKVTLCKEINMFVTFANTAGVLDMTGSQPVSTTDLTGVAAITAAGAGLQWGFVVQGPVGSQIITLTLRQVITATGVLNVLTPANVVTFTAAAPTDRFVVKLFDSKTGVWAASGIQKWTAANTYNTATTASDNVLCVDTLTQDYTGEYVQNTPNSVPGFVANKLNFTGDYVVAHIMTAVTYNLVTCKGATCGNLVLGTGGQTASCVSFDYETIGTGVNGYCTNHTATGAGMLPKLIVQSSQAFELVNYSVTAQILVNGAAGTHGVYWSNTAPAYKTSATDTCGTAVGALAFAGQTFYLADGTTAGVGIAPGANNCAAVAAANKVVSFTTTSGALFAAGDLYFELNLPDLVYNLAEVNAGDVVTVRVTLTKNTCGAIGPFDLCVGTFIAACPAAAATTTTAFPYFTSLTADANWWNGIAIVNNSATAGTAVLTAYEQDGSVGTFTTPSIAANSMYVNLLENISWSGVGLGGSPVYISVTSNFPSVLGFGMIANPVSGESMGYLSKP